MKFGHLAEFVKGAGAKHLTEVELAKQHEFQGVKSFQEFLGRPAEKVEIPATFFWLDDEIEDANGIEGHCTWSDVRRAKPNRSPEYHLYYSAEANQVVAKARAGDLAVVAKTADDNLVVVLCPAETTVAHQLMWLFGLDLFSKEVDATAISADKSNPLGFVAYGVLEALGIPVTAPEPDAFEKLLDTFGMRFPTTVEMSRFARETFGDADPLGAPDETLVGWIEHELALFTHLERHVVSDRLSKGFMTSGAADVDEFLKFSLSVHNRRKSRAGWALGHHAAAIFDKHSVRYTREATTEKRNGPDFLFPGEAEYHDGSIRPELLTMLGAKTSCKDHWRQVLAEAHKIKEKHLLTLEAAISEAQTGEMQSEHLQLVVPQPIHETYRPAQQKWLLSLKEFIELIVARQHKYA